VDFVTPLKKRRLARESLSVDGSLRSISEEEDSPSARMASPPDAMPPSGTVSSVDNSTSAIDFHFQVRILCSRLLFKRSSQRKALKVAGLGTLQP